MRFMVGASDLDFHFHAAGKLELHEGVDSLGGRVVDIDQTLERRKLELLARLLVDEGRAVDSEDALVGGQGDGTADYRAGGLHSLHDLLGALVDEVVIVRFEFDTDFLAHIFVCFIVYLSRSTRPWHSVSTALAMVLDTSA